MSNETMLRTADKSSSLTPDTFYFTLLLRTALPTIHVFSQRRAVGVCKAPLLAIDPYWVVRYEFFCAHVQSASPERQYQPPASSYYAAVATALCPLEMTYYEQLYAHLRDRIV